MFTVVVTFKIKSGMMEQFMPHMISNAQQSLAKETGCKQFDVCTDDDSPGEVFLYEIYDDEPAFQRHRETTHFQAFDRISADMIADKTVRTYAKVAS